MRLSGNLKRTRLRRKMSQYALAEKSNVSRQTIIRIENGEGEDGTTIGTIKQLAQALGVRVEELVQEWMEF